jgi:rubrerythrin
VLASFAQEEMKHKAKLEGIQAGGAFKPSGEQVANLKVAEYIMDVTPDPNVDYRGVLVIAMKKEKAAFKLYTDLAASTADSTIRETFLALAQEEARHKLHFEVEYDDLLAEN